MEANLMMGNALHLLENLIQLDSAGARRDPDLSKNTHWAGTSRTGGQTI